jgi:hypothetical protein
MKAIIISDHECRALLDSLQLASLKEAGHLRLEEVRDEQTLRAHRVYHYVVTRWLQEMGADVVGRDAP